MFEELDKVILNHDIKEHNLKEGDRGTVVHVYDKSEGYEVEFFNAKGDTIAVLTLMPDDICSIISKNEHIFNPAIFNSNASVVTFTQDTTQNTLAGFNSILGIEKISIKTEKGKSIKEF